MIHRKRLVILISPKKKNVKIDQKKFEYAELQELLDQDDTQAQKQLIEKLKVCKPASRSITRNRKG